MELADAASASFAVGLDAARRAAPPGIAVRALRDGDYAPMADVRNAAARADGDRVTTADRIRADLELDDAPPASRVILAETDGRLVGWVRATDRGVAPDVGRNPQPSRGVDPDWRARGIGRALLAGAQALLRELDRLVPDDASPMFEAWVPATGIATARLLRHAGYAIENWNIDMLRPSLDDLPPVDLPPGIESRPVQAEDVFPVMIAWDDAMRDHPGWAPLSDTRMRDAIHHPLLGQIDVWQVAWDGDRVVGGVLGYIDEQENRERHRRRGYTENIFTRRPWRGRGIASGLAARNLHVLRERGMTEAALQVDTQNPNGALALYERLGFREHDQTHVYRRPA